MAHQPGLESDSVLRSNIQINDNGFIFAFDLGSTFTANPSAVELMRLLQQGLDRSQIKSEMMRRFGISEAEFEKDFQDFTVQLRNLKLLL